MAYNPLQAYQKTQKSNLSPREVEAMAFTKAAKMLEDAKSKVHDIQAYSQALRFNHLLWTIIQADIVEPANELPPELKANIMSLSIFVDKQTAKAMRGNEPKDLDILITINMNLAAGLRTEPPVSSMVPPDSAEQVAAVG